MTAICRRLLQGQLAWFRNLGQLGGAASQGKVGEEVWLAPRHRTGAGPARRRCPGFPPLPRRKKQLKKKVKSAKVLLVEPKRHLSQTNLRPDPAYAAAAADGQAGPNSGKVQINIGASGSDRCQGGYVTEVTDRVLFALSRVNDRVPLVLLQRQNSSPPWCPDAREEPEDMFMRSRMRHFHWMASERLFGDAATFPSSPGCCSKTHASPVTTVVRVDPGGGIESYLEAKEALNA